MGLLTKIRNAIAGFALSIGTYIYNPKRNDDAQPNESQAEPTETPPYRIREELRQEQTATVRQYIEPQHTLLRHLFVLYNSARQLNTGLVQTRLGIIPNEGPKITPEMYEATLRVPIEYIRAIGCPKQPLTGLDQEDQTRFGALTGTLAVLADHYAEKGTLEPTLAQTTPHALDQIIQKIVDRTNAATPRQNSAYMRQLLATEDKKKQPHPVIVLLSNLAAMEMIARGMYNTNPDPYAPRSASAA